MQGVFGAGKESKCHANPIQYQDFRESRVCAQLWEQEPAELTKTDPRVRTEVWGIFIYHKEKSSVKKHM